MFKEKFELFIEGFYDDLKTPYTIITIYVQEWHELINLLFLTNIQTNVYCVESTQNQKWQSESRNVPV